MIEDPEAQQLAQRVTVLMHRHGFDHVTQSNVTQPVGVVLADLDRFIFVNHERGHSVGDAVLEEVNRRIVAITSPGTVAARFGGDVFAMFLPDVKDMSHVQAAAVAVLRTLDLPIDVGDLHLNLSFSVGVALAPPGELTAGLHDADVAMYEAKMRGRARAVCLNPEWEAF